MGDMSAKLEGLPSAFFKSSELHPDDDGEDLSKVVARVAKARPGSLQGSSRRADGSFPEEDEREGEGPSFVETFTATARRVFGGAASCVEALGGRRRFAVLLPVTTILAVAVMPPRMSLGLPEVLVGFLLVGEDDEVVLEPRGRPPTAVLISEMPKRDRLAVRRLKTMMRSTGSTIR